MMEPLEPLAASEQSISILVVSDSNMINLCDEPQEYVDRFKTRINELRENKASLFTVSGRYGLSNIDKSIPVIEIHYKNKTLFKQMLENNSMLFDEVIAISAVTFDPYIDSAREVATATNKTFTQYSYPRKG